MPTVIGLQHNFAYGFIPILILFIILISPLFYYFIKKFRETKDAPAEMVPEVMPKLKPLPAAVKEAYILRLRDLCKSIDEGNLPVREGYLKLSSFIREFVLEYDGIDLTSKTLAELRAYKMPELITLVEEYYVPEFSRALNDVANDDPGSGQSGYDYKKSIENTIRVIEKWN